MLIEKGLISTIKTQRILRKFEPSSPLPLFSFIVVYVILT